MRALRRWSSPLVAPVLFLMFFGIIAFGFRFQLYFLMQEFRPSGYFLEFFIGVLPGSATSVADDVRNADVLILTPDLLPARVRGGDGSGSPE